MTYMPQVSVAVNKKPARAVNTALSRLSTVIVMPNSANRVIIKPSVLDPSLAGNTSKELLRCVVRLFDRTYPVYVVESDNPFRTAEDAFERAGYGELKSDSVILQNLSLSPAESIQLAGPGLSDIAVPKLLVEPGGLLVNVATAKTDPGGIGFSASIKNLFGLVPRKDKDIYHPVLEPLLLGLLSRFRPCLSVVDMTELIIGPRDLGQTRHLGGVAVSTDPVALDSFCAGMFGIDPMSIPLLRRARELGLGEAMLDRIKVVGTDHQKRIMAEAFDQAKHNQKQYIRIS